MRRAALIALAAALALPAQAAAADRTVQAVDATLAWSPPDVTVKAGESVTWTFAGSRGYVPESCHTFQKFALQS